jgi:predicted dehydrogenase
MTESFIQVQKSAQGIQPYQIKGDIRVGLIGAGYWGPKLARNFHEIPGSVLKAVSDLRPDRLQEINHLFPEVMTTPTYEDIFEHVDAVVIATPVHTHYRMAKEALEAGKHVLVEKPITSNSDQARQLADLARQNGLTLMVGHTLVYNPAVEAVRKIVKSGQLGDIFYINATRANLGLFQPDINVMWDLAPHDISMLRYILGQEPVAVSACGAAYVNTRYRLHEIVYLNMFFNDGVLANIHLSWLDPVKQRRLMIVGSKKMLVYNDIADDKVVIFDKGVEFPAYSVTEEEFQASYRHGGESAYPLQWVEPLRVECSHFLECIRTGATPRSSGKDGLRVVQILETAQRSLMNHGAELVVEY